jgi:SAM-dependent methyltransferase
VGTTASGAAYVDSISRRSSDRRARAVFRALALQLVPPREALFDFGSGPGLDAKFYARRGIVVEAYDVDPAMCDYCATYCREELASGQITLTTGPYAAFVDVAGPPNGGKFALVTANFAPLNLIGDLRELFRKFHSITTPHGRLLASVLSPYYVGDMRYAWWWRNLPKLVSNGHYTIAAEQAGIVRRRVADFEAQAGPYFRLAGVWPGLFYGPAQTAIQRGLKPAHRRWRPALAASRFMFLLFERNEVGRPGEFRSAR